MAPGNNPEAIGVPGHEGAALLRGLIARRQSKSKKQEQDPTNPDRRGKCEFHPRTHAMGVHLGNAPRRKCRVVACPRTRQRLGVRQASGALAAARRERTSLQFEYKAAEACRTPKASPRRGASAGAVFECTHAME